MPVIDGGSTGRARAKIFTSRQILSIVFFFKFARQTQARHRHPVDVDVGQATAPSGQPYWAGGERAYSYGGRTKLPCRAAGVRDGDRRCRVAPIVASVTRDRRRQVCAAVRSPLRNGGEEAWTCVHTYMPLCALLRILPRSGSVMPACSRRALPPAPPTVPALSRPEVVKRAWAQPLLQCYGCNCAAHASTFPPVLPASAE